MLVIGVEVSSVEVVVVLVPVVVSEPLKNKGRLSNGIDPAINSSR